MAMQLREYFERGQKEGWSLGAFNIDSLDIFKAVLMGAKNKKSPVIVEFSKGEIGYFGMKNVVDMVINGREDYQIPIFLNLDHGKKEEVMDAIDHPGFNMVHFDGSEHEYNENIEIAKKIVDTGHAKGLLVEGEIDNVAGQSVVHGEDLDIQAVKNTFTDPKKALEFVQKTRVDIFAPIFGNVHGTFPNQPDLDIALLSNIRQTMPNTFFSLHGSSGIPAEQVKEAIKVGKIVKVNINTELRQAYRDAMVEELGEEPAQYKVYEYSEDVVRAVAAVVENKIDVFGSADKI